VKISCQPNANSIHQASKALGVPYQTSPGVMFSVPIKKYRFIWIRLSAELPLRLIVGVTRGVIVCS
jgi:hypothetical protein